MAGLPIQRLNDKRRQPLTDMQVRALQNYADNGYKNLRQALLDAGYSPSNLHVATRALHNEIIELTESILVTSAPSAAQTIVSVMESEEAIAQAANKLDAAKTILDRIGLGKKDQLNVNHEVSGGIAILPAKRVLEAEDVYEE